MRGALARIGDTLDRFTGRKWEPVSGLATSGLVERLKTLLDSEKKEVAGKGMVVPHNITLRMQWDKFSTDDENAGLTKLRNELLAAAADHINDNLYYTYAPLHLEVKQDYFTDGVKMLVSFEDFAEVGSEAEMNVTMPAIKIPIAAAEPPRIDPIIRVVEARFVLNGKDIEKTLNFPPDGRLTVGRTSTNGLTIDDISVSKVHASLAINADGLSVADTGSTNGTFINDERIAYGKAVRFNYTDRVKFGTVEVTFTLMEPETAAEEEASDRNSVQIGDLEFRSRVADSTPRAVPDDTAPVSASHLATQKIDDEVAGSNETPHDEAKQ